MRVWKNDVVPLALFAGLGATLGWWLVGETRSVFFYQMFTPEALMWACGDGLHRPDTLPPEMADFLVHRSVPAFDCATIPPDLSVGPPGFCRRTAHPFTTKLRQ